VLALSFEPHFLRQQHVVFPQNRLSPGFRCQVHECPLSFAWFSFSSSKFTSDLCEPVPYTRHLPSIASADKHAAGVDLGCHGAQRKVSKWYENHPSAHYLFTKEYQN